MSKEPEPEGKTDESKDPETDPNDLSPADVKIILLGDSAVGKTKLVETGNICFGVLQTAIFKPFYLEIKGKKV